MLEDMTAGEWFTPIERKFISSVREEAKKEVIREVEKAFGDSEELLYGDWEKLKKTLSK
jgi:hypothetical protein